MKFINVIKPKTASETGTSVANRPGAGGGGCVPKSGT